MFTATLARFIPKGWRVRFFVLGSLSCLPTVVMFSVWLVLAQDATQARIAGFMCAAAVSGSLTHVCILLAVMSGKSVWFWVADFLVVIGVAVAFGAVGLSSSS